MSIQTPLTRTPVGTLFGAPTVRDQRPGKLAVLGIPYDMGTHQTRVGARSGPAHIRSHSRLVADHMLDFAIDLVEELDVVDWGDAAVFPGQVDSSFATIEEIVREIVNAGATPLTFGGDGAVTLPILRALKAAGKGEIALIHFDAHTDAYDVESPFKFNNMNTFIHSIHEDLLLTDKSIHVGMRDGEFPTKDGIIAQTRNLGYDVVTMSDIDEMGAAQVGAMLRERFDGIPVYLCWDMDVFDPSVSPGVVAPSWGGLTVREGLSILRAMRGLEFVAFDINTVSPPHDPNGASGALAAQVAMECLFLAYAQKGLSHEG